MTAADWREFVPLVRISTAACPVSAIVAQLRDAAREFCSGSRIWTHESEPADIVAGEDAYGLHAPSHAEVCAVLSVRAKGRRLAPLGADQWRALERRAAPEPSHFIIMGSGLLRLHPAPEADIPAALIVDAALQPSAASARCPQFLFTRHGAAIAQGAQARLMLIPDRPWSDAKTGVFLREEFKAAVAAAAIDVERGGADAPSRVRYRPFI